MSNSRHPDPADSNSNQVVSPDGKVWETYGPGDTTPHVQVGRYDSEGNLWLTYRGTDTPCARSDND